ncbi:hypothetical protein HYFRA_00000824 [Hymenoscyphus fraxineus]|uniref:Uncharacterized protein n=1 Tax=Hymenoscyphus fraxineus TaxID=746836 RepID=A0A9N9PM93_9HELO|nr:hypothetical protein HYFRA_00000824 [Hymenoscyphus fraxineus]
MDSQYQAHDFEGLFTEEEGVNTPPQPQTANISVGRHPGPQPSASVDLNCVLRAIMEAEKQRTIHILNRNPGDLIKEPTSTDPAMEMAYMAQLGIMNADDLQLEGDISYYLKERSEIGTNLQPQLLVFPDGSPARYTCRPHGLDVHMLAPEVFKAFKDQHDERSRTLESEYETRLGSLNVARENQNMPLLARNDLTHPMNSWYAAARSDSRAQLLSDYLELLRDAQISFITYIVCPNCQRHHFDLKTLQQWEMLKNAWTVSTTDVGDGFEGAEIFANSITVDKCMRKLLRLVGRHISAVDGTRCRRAQAGRGYYLL